jgi:hypothetical protein
VDKALRRLSQDFTVLTNLEKTQILGFTIPKVLRRATYTDQNFTRPIETGYLKLDVAQYGKLYDTNAGVGIVGRTDLKERKGGGRHPIWALVFVVAAILACIYVPRMVLGGVQKAATDSLMGFSQGMVDKYPVKPLTNAAKANPEPMAPVVAPIIQTQTAQAAQDKTNKLTIVRRMIIGPKRTYWLSDGRKLVQGDIEVLVAQEDYIILTGGKVVWFDK